MRSVTVTVLVAGLAAAAVATPAEARVSCHSGRTEFRHGGIRAFSIGRVEGNPRDEGSHYRTYYVCGRGARKPIVFDPGQPFNVETVGGYKVYGDRLGFWVQDQGLQSGESVTVDWVRLPRGPVKEGLIFAEEDLPEEQELEEHVPKFPADEFEYAIAPDGVVAVAGEAHNHAVAGEPLEWQVYDMTVKGHGLSRPKALFSTKTRSEAPVLKTIAVNDSTVSWTNRAGTPVSLPR